MESARSWLVRRLTKLSLLVETRAPSESDFFLLDFELLLTFYLAVLSLTLSTALATLTLVLMSVPFSVSTRWCVIFLSQQAMKYSNLLQQDGSKGSVEDVLRPGREMVAAGYTMYGSSCNLVLSTGNGVDGFTLDEVSRSFNS